MGIPGIPDVAVLRSGVDALWTSLDRDGGYTLQRGPRQRAFSLLWGTCVQAVRQARAYFLLEEAGFDREAFVNARAALEHAVTAQWVLHREGGLDRFAVTLTRLHKQDAERMGLYLGNTELLALAESTKVPDGNGIPKFGQIIDEFEKQGFLATSYSQLSQAAHVRMQTISAFLEIEEETTFLRFDPQHAFTKQSAYVAAVSAMLATHAIFEIAGEKDILAILDKMSDEMQCPMTLRPELPEEVRSHYLEDEPPVGDPTPVGLEI